MVRESVNIENRLYLCIDVTFIDIDFLLRIHMSTFYQTLKNYYQLPLAKKKAFKHWPVRPFTSCLSMLAFLQGDEGGCSVC